MIQLQVEDMTCGHCASTVTRAVRSVDPHAKCEIDLGAKSVRISSDQPVQRFTAAIQQAGYVATAAEARNLAP